MRKGIILILASSALLSGCLSTPNEARNEAPLLSRESTKSP
nr:MAG TPA: Prokaryotic membrane lipoprotein lipid attachment site [Caudoviricetes sp.]